MRQLNPDKIQFEFLATCDFRRLLTL